MRQANEVDEAINKYLDTNDASILQKVMGEFSGELACGDDELAYCIKRSDLKNTIERLKKITTNFSGKDDKNMTDDDKYIIKDFSEDDDSVDDSVTNDKLDKIIRILELAQEDETGYNLTNEEYEDDSDDSPKAIKSDYGDTYVDDGSDIASEEDYNSDEDDDDLDDDYDFSYNFGLFGDGKPEETKDNLAYYENNRIVTANGRIRELLRGTKNKNGEKTKGFFYEVNLYGKGKHMEKETERNKLQKPESEFFKMCRDFFEKYIMGDALHNFSARYMVKLLENDNLNFSDKVFLFAKNAKIDDACKEKIYKAFFKQCYYLAIHPSHPDLVETAIEDFLKDLHDILYKKFSYLDRQVRRLTNFDDSSFKTAADLDLDDAAKQEMEGSTKDYLQKQLENAKKYDGFAGKFGGSKIARQDKEKYKQKIKELSASEAKDKDYLTEKKRLANEQKKKEEELIKKLQTSESNN